MILEVAILNVRDGAGAAFEAAFREASPIIASMPGYVSHELRRCIEFPARYLLLVHWRRLEDHTVGFRQSVDYQRWRELLHHFYDPFPTVEHYSEPLEGTPFVREVIEEDISTFFDQQRDATANYMAAFTAKEPTNRAAFLARWERIRSDATVIARTIVINSQVAGHVMSYEEAGRCEVTYWLGKEYWGKGIATRALAEFLAEVNRSRPTYARAAKDNTGSLRVLEKCGFTLIGEARGFANARGKEIDEVLLELR